MKTDASDLYIDIFNVFVQEIEAIEEQWRTESAELVTAVARLQDENKRLRRTINAPADGEYQ